MKENEIEFLIYKKLYSKYIKIYKHVIYLR